MARFNKPAAYVQQALGRTTPDALAARYATPRPASPAEMIVPPVQVPGRLIEEQVAFDFLEGVAKRNRATRMSLFDPVSVPGM